MKKPTYLTNPDKRCLYCKGREVITTTDEGIETSLEKDTKNKSILRCKNKEECQQNIDAENTIYKFNEDMELTKIIKDKEVIFEVTRK